MSNIILLVDDEPPMLERLQRILATLGHVGDGLRVATSLAGGKLLPREPEPERLHTDLSCELVSPLHEREGVPLLRMS
jgi:hypothetical protein